jgi:FkbM family methyltransferase
MKSIKEFNFLRKECGFFYALFYMFYKIDLAFLNSSTALKWKKSKEAWLDKINSALYIYSSTTITIKGQKYIRVDAGLPDSLYLRPYSSDMDVYLQVFINNDYKSVIDIYDQIFKVVPKNIIDCGCNIGLTTIYFFKHYPNAKYVSIEPIKNNIEMIKLNFKASGISNYTLIEGGVWNDNRSLSVSEKFRDGKEWSFNLEAGNNKIGEIQSYSLLDIVTSCGDTIDILKIDVEGTERILFQDDDYARQFLKRVKCVAIEIHDEFDCRHQIYKSFSENNFFYYDIQDMTIAINRSYVSGFE